MVCLVWPRSNVELQILLFLFIWLNPLLTKLVPSKWLYIGLILFCVVIDLNFVSVKK